MSILTVVFCFFCGGCISSCQICFLYSSVGTLLWWCFLPWDLLDWLSLSIFSSLQSLLLVAPFIYFVHYYLCYFFNLLNLSLWYCSCLGINWTWSFQLSSSERVTSRKARDLQREELASKYQTFVSLLSGRRKQTMKILFSFSIQI